MSTRSISVSSGGGSLQPHASISAQELAQSCPEKCGFLRKRGKAERIFENLHLSKHINWRQKFVVVKDGCCYCFADEVSKSPSQCWSLQGYNRVFRHKADRAAFGTVFALEPAGVGKLQVFAASNEQEMKQWMRAFREAMIQANPDAIGLDSGGSNPDDMDYITLEKPLYEVERSSQSNGQSSDESGDDGEYISDDSDYDVPDDEMVKTAKANIAASKEHRALPPLPALPGDQASEEHKSTPSKVGVALPGLRPEAHSPPAVPTKPRPQLARRSESSTSSSSSHDRPAARVSPTERWQSIDSRKPAEIPKQHVETPTKPAIRPKQPVETPKKPVISPKQPVETPKKPVVSPKQHVAAPKSPPATPTKPSPSNRVLPPKPNKAPPRRVSERDCFFDDDREAALHVIEEAEDFGTCLIRKSRQGDQRVLVVKTSEGVKEYKIFILNGYYTLDKKDYFNNIDEMLQHYISAFLPHRQEYLTRPYSSS